MLTHLGASPTLPVQLTFVYDYYLELINYQTIYYPKATYYQCFDDTAEQITSNYCSSFMHRFTKLNSDAIPNHR